MAADHLIKLPDTIPFETAAAMTMRGLTSSYLLRRIAPGLKPATPCCCTPPPAGSASSSRSGPACWVSR